MFTLNTLTGEYWQGPPPMDAGYLLDQNARNLFYEAKGLRNRGSYSIATDATDASNASVAGAESATIASAQVAQAVPASQLSFATLALIGIVAYLVLK